MENANATPPAKRNFCVWADYVRRMHQHVEAENPAAAYEVAKSRPDNWEACESHDNNGYRVSNDVQNLDTEEFVPVHGTKNCKRCGSEIVECINDSNFREGECGPCEYERYRLQPEIANVLNSLLSETLDNDLDVGNELTEREQDLRETALVLLTKADGNAH